MYIDRSRNSSRIKKWYWTLSKSHVCSHLSYYYVQKEGELPLCRR